MNGAKWLQQQQQLKPKTKKFKHYQALSPMKYMKPYVMLCYVVRCANHKTFHCVCFFAQFILDVAGLLSFSQCMEKKKIQNHELLIKFKRMSK